MSDALPHNPVNPGRSIVITPDDTSLSLAQAIYHHVTTKTEQISETFPDAYIVRADDFLQLAHILKQVAQRHHEGEWSCVIDHALFKRSRTRHSSLERFKAADRSSADATSEIVITYDFLCANPFADDRADINPERYKIVVRVSQEHYLSLTAEDDAQPRFFKRLLVYPSISATIQYVDYTVARAILSGVREWVEGLSKSKKSKLSKFFARNEFSLAESLPRIFAACTFLGAAGISTKLNEMSGAFLFCAFAVAALMHAVGYLVSEGIANNVYLLQEPSVILITKGDDTHYASIKKKRSRAFGAISLLFIGIVLAILVNIFSSYLYDKIS